MPWNDNNGGGRGPWGQGPTGGGPSGAPDLEEILRRGQDRLRQAIPGGSLGGGAIGLIVLVVVGLWMMSGFYRVQTDEQGVELRFGKFVALTQPGLNYHWPWPIETALTPRVTFVNRVDVGMRSASSDVRVAVRDVPEESLMLTGDENIVDVDFTVQWKIKNAEEYLFRLQNQESTVKAVAESSMREIVGHSDIKQILSEGRQKAETEAQDLMQATLDSYEAGIEITEVNLQKVDPPGAVIDSYRDVQAAEADQERLRNEAEAYANKVIPEARGQAAVITEAAEGYRNSVIAEAKGQASRFNAIYAEYRLAPEVTRRRMYLETMERVFGGMDKIIIDEQATGSGVVPYLPLDQIARERRTDTQGGQ